MGASVNREVESFLGQWLPPGEPLRLWFTRMYRELVAMEGVSLEFVARPGVSYSLRPRHRRQRDRTLFAIVDVIDDNPNERWLSLCFYGDMVSDPEERGQLIPGGLAGDDGYCFDMAADEPDLGSYLLARLAEAAAKAAA
jgi:hypothetical protein